MTAPSLMFEVMMKSKRFSAIRMYGSAIVELYG